eukprot:gene13917-18663_t
MSSSNPLKKPNSDFVSLAKHSSAANNNDSHSSTDVVEFKRLEKKISFVSENFDLWKYLKVEMFGIGDPGHIQPPERENMKNFFVVPFMIEKLIWLGWWVCLDSFLYVITYLPIRYIFSWYLLFLEVGRYIMPLFGSNMFSVFGTHKKGRKNSKTIFQFHRTHIYDLMRGTIMIISCLILRQANMSVVYHTIRGQGIIKLYVLTGMMETLDKLLSTFGQDIFDSLHYQTRSKPWSSRLLFLFIIVTLYVCIHSGLYFFQVATLTVVLNSADQHLLSVLILNNFSELKQFVFKKFEPINLFQLSSADITERFHMTLSLGMILFVGLIQAGAGWYELLPGYIRIILMMVTGEMLADAVKHAFIIKFNSINPNMYKDFAFIICGDILSNQKDTIILDHTYSVTRRLGLSQIPLGCVWFRCLLLAISSPSCQNYFSKMPIFAVIAHGVLFFSALVSLKLIIGIALVFYSGYYHNAELNKQAGMVRSTSSTALTAMAVSPQATPVKIDSNGVVQMVLASPPQTTYQPITPLRNTTTISTNQPPNVVSSDPEIVDEVAIHNKLMEELSNIERYTVYKGRVIG